MTSMSFLSTEWFLIFFGRNEQQLKHKAKRTISQTQRKKLSTLREIFIFDHTLRHIHQNLFENEEVSTEILTLIDYHKWLTIKSDTKDFGLEFPKMTAYNNQASILTGKISIFDSDNLSNLKRSLKV